jgi:PAS domain S-box-containing protein
VRKRQSPPTSNPALDAIGTSDVLLRTLLAHFPNGSVNVFDHDLRYRLAAGQGLAAVGLSSEQLVGRTLAELFEPAEFDYVAPFYRRALAGETVEFEFHFSNLWYTITATPLRDAADTILAIVAVAQDITERKQTEITLREQAETLATINQIGQLLSAELDLQKLVQAVTDAATALTEAAFGAFFYNVIDDRGESYTLYTLAGAPHEAFAQFPMPRNTHVFGPTFRGEGVIRLDDVTKDPRYGQNPPYYGKPAGHLPVVSYLAVLVVSRSGQVLGGLFFGHPQPGVFTERAERIVVGLAAQAAIAMDNAQLYQQAQEAIQLREQFLSIAAHELKTPLTSLMGNAQLLERRATREGTLSERDRRAANVIAEQAKRLSKLIRALLDISRIEQGQLRVERTPLDLSALVQRAIDESQPRLEKHTIACEIPDTPLLVMGDELRLEQVLQNLIDNAIKYSPAGGHVLVQVEPRGDWVDVRVTDQGIGIADDELPNLFQRFYRTRNADADYLSGLGIGLYVVREIVRLHDGTVEVASREGHGSVFTVRLPREQHAAGQTTAGPSALPRAGR